MSPLLLGILVIVCIGALGFAFVPALSGGDRAAKRMKAMQRDPQVNRQMASAQRSRETRRRTVQDALKSQTDALNAKRKKNTLKNRLFQAGIKTDTRVWIRNCIILGTVLFVVLFFLQIPVLFALVFAVAGAYVLPNMFLSARRKRYQAAYLDELPNAVEAIVRGVKSGLPLNDSIRLVAKELKEPVKSEFTRVLEQQSVGKSMTEAVEVLFDRVPLPEVNFFVVVITVQQQAGGNLSEALSNLARVLRDRKKMKGKIKAMSSEAKSSAMIIGALPLFVIAAISVVSPSYLVPLWTTSGGLVALGGAVCMLAMGIFVMYRMVQFEY
ncbi:type II secretion system F family protein [Pelagibacterium xiamenense]|uniref:type II secretion system F family protein n=1 Tax=Pelagibacterium xiamenense TaxID=2901140 RepID=UPI001E55AF99|nr:type II secretion system F family protein [Pelagibacterium xiamenense]MCD7058874.1 type II secretion system F family protein [Pelagibacterium xiamenense]